MCENGSFFTAVVCTKSVQNTNKINLDIFSFLYNHLMQSTLCDHAYGALPLGQHMHEANFSIGTSYGKKHFLWQIVWEEVFPLANRTGRRVSFGKSYGKKCFLWPIVWEETFPLAHRMGRNVFFGKSLGKHRLLVFHWWESTSEHINCR